MDIADGLLGSVKDGQVVCSTCHDIVHQYERPKPHYALQNRGFLRDRTSRTATDYCFKCHDSTALEKLSPHSGVAGSPSRPTGLLCHENLPAIDATGGLNVAFNMKHDLNDACRGCHDTRPHPKSMSMFYNKADEGWIHLVEPSTEVATKMQASLAQTGIELPLDPRTGLVTCATCHNPHEFKVGGEHGSESRDVKHRLRMDNICQACHEK